MCSKLFIVAVLVTLVCVHGIKIASNKDQELASSETEERILIEVPLIGTVLMVTFKIAGLIMNAIGPLLQYKLAALTLIANVTSWMYSFFIIIGTVFVVGFCVIIGTFNQEPEYQMDHRLIEAARHLNMGALKYARMIN